MVGWRQAVFAVHLLCMLRRIELTVTIEAF